MSCSMALRRSPKPGALTATELVHDERGEGLALDVLGDDRERLAGLDDLLQQRQQVLDRRDLAVDDEDVRVLELRLLTLQVGDEVGRDVALVEPHTLGELELQPEGVGLVDGDDAFLADLVHRLGDHLADLRVGGRDGGRGSDLLLGLHLLGLRQELGRDRLDGLLDAPLERHRVGPRGDVAQTLLHQRLSQNGRRRRAVAGHVVGLLGDLLDQLGPDLLVRVLELDLLGDGHTVVGDRGGAPLLLQNDVAALRPQGDPHGIGQGVQAPLEPTPGLLVKRDDLGHRVVDPSAVPGGYDRTAPATDGPAATRSCPARARPSPHRSGEPGPRKCCHSR
jgi:hypothetical protein